MMKALATALLLAIAPTSAQAQAAGESLTIALGGDMIGPFHPIADVRDPGFDGVRAIFRGADIGFANQEGAIFDLEGFPGFPAPENGGGYPRQPRSAAAEIRGMGIALMSKANNHATDWGTQGLLATMDSLKAAGIAWAGAGRDPATACAAAISGGVALVSAATTFPPMSLPVATVNRRGPPGTPPAMSQPGPGICAIHVQAVREVPVAELGALRAIAGPLALAGGSDGGEVRIGDQRFRAASRAGIAWDMKPEDLPPVLSAVRKAKVGARAVIFAVHAHETAGTVDDMPPRDFEPLLLHRANEAPGAANTTPAAFFPDLARQAIDAGADIVVRTGPHQLSGIEVYRGKPIFYGLASLVFDFGGRRGYTAATGQSIAFRAEWYDTVIPTVTLRRGRISELRLYPATIDGDATPTGGLPRLATGADAARILARLQQLSSAYGTRIRIAGNVGLIQLDAN